MFKDVSNMTIQEIEAEINDINKLRELRSKVSIQTMLNEEVDLSVLQKYNLTITPNGQIFKKDVHGFLPQIIEKMFSDRKKYKNIMLDYEKELETLNSDLEKRMHNYSDEMKEEVRRELKNNIAKFDNLQANKKICLNSSFGASGNQFFRFYDIRQAEAITTYGQLAIKWIQKHVNNYLNELLGTKGADYIIASDTDSCVGETEIYVDDEKQKIEDVYRKYANNTNLINQRDENDFIHDISSENLVTKSYKDGKIVNDKIVKIMKHRVKKRMFSIKIDGKEVIITEDHSIMIKRDGILMETRPIDLLPTDELIYINNSDTIQYQRNDYKWQKEN